MHHHNLISSSKGIIPLITCCILLILIQPGQAVMDEAAHEKLREAFSVTQPSTDDCNPKLTTETIKFLSTKNADRDNVNFKGDSKGHFPVDCSFRKTDFNKLRNFMWNSGFFQNPGSLHLINDQDTNLKLDCGREGRWSVVDLNTKKDDDDFNSDGLYTQNLNVVAPVGYRYFRKYTCFSMNKPKCTHTSYVITRPHPKIEFPLQAMEGAKTKFYCRINGCTTGVPKNDDHKEHGCTVGGKEVTDVVSQAPYSIELRVPKTIFKKGTPLPEGWKMPSCNDDNKDDDDNAKEPIYWKVIKDDGKAILKKGEKRKGVEVEGGFEVADPITEKIKGVQSVVSIDIKINEVSTKHAGFYECVAIDKNGVPSIPKQETFSSHRRFSGKTKLHVRPFYMIIIPSAIIGAILVLMFLIWVVFKKNDKMEHDDGTQYTKEERVTPTAEPPPQAAE